jgi:hypothetical protein
VVEDFRSHPLGFPTAYYEVPVRSGGLCVQGPLLSLEDAANFKFSTS